MRISDWSSDVCSSDLFKLNVAGFGIGNDRGGRGIFAVQSLDLIGIENRVSFQKRNGALVVRLGVLHDKLVSIDNGGPLAALPDIAAKLQCLFEGQPIGGGEALTHGAGPKAEDVRSEEHTSELQSLMRIS